MEKILIAARLSAGRKHIEDMLRTDFYEVSTADTAAEAISALMKDEPGVMLLDTELPDMSEALNKGREAVPDLRVILITASEKNADTGIPTAGDCSCIRMHSEPAEIRQIIRLNSELRDLRQQNDALKQQSELPLSLNIIAESEQMRLILEQAAEAARHESAAMMISGESGTGKKTVAQSVHLLSSRKAYAFLEINCAAFPDTLLERKLFGYEKEASAGKKGYLRSRGMEQYFLMKSADYLSNFRKSCPL